MSGYNLGVAVGGFARLIQDHFGIYPKCFTEKLIPWLKGYCQEIPAGLPRG